MFDGVQPWAPVSGVLSTIFSRVSLRLELWLCIDFCWGLKAHHGVPGSPARCGVACSVAVCGMHAGMVTAAASHSPLVAAGAKARGKPCSHHRTLLAALICTCSYA